MSESVVDRCLKCVCLCCCYRRPAREWIVAEGGGGAKVQPPSRVNTYGLERFQSNALLILAQTEPQGRPYVDQRVELLSRSFGAFRFRVEAHVDLDPKQMEARLEEFFSQDFSRVGAVCVAVVGGAGEAGQLPARAQHCQDSLVLRHLTDELPSSLVGRPRIYITEMARSGAVSDSGAYSLPISTRFPDVIGAVSDSGAYSLPISTRFPDVIGAVSDSGAYSLPISTRFPDVIGAVSDSGAYSLPISTRFPDVIAVHIPVIIEGEASPLQMLCARLGTEREFRADVMAAAHAAETAFPALARRPIQVDNTLSLDLELVRAKSEPDANGTTESLTVGANGTPENVPNGANGHSENLPDGTKGASA